MKIRLQSLFFTATLCFFILPGTVELSAQTDPGRLELAKDPGFFQLTFGRVELIEDPEEKLSIQDILQKSAEFKPSVKEIPNYGFGNGAYWVRVQVKNREQHTPWLLELAYPMIDDIRLFVVEPATRRILLEKEAGDRFPFAQRDVAHRNFIFDLPLDYNQDRDIYLRVESRGSVIIPLVLATRGELFDKNYFEENFIWFFYGIMGVMIFYNLFLFLSLRDPGYLYYVLYLTAGALYLAGLNGISFQVFWPNSVWWNQHAVVLALVLNPLAGAKFGQIFLSTKENAPRFHTFFNILIILMAINFVVSLYDTVLGSKIQVPLVLAQYFSALAAGVVIYFRGFKPARFYLIAFTVLVASVFVHTFRIVGILPTNFLTFNATQIGIGIEMVLLSLALADRINRLKEDRERAQEEAIALRDENVAKLQSLNRSFSRFVPDEFLRILGKNSIEDVKLGDQALQDMTVMFIDIRSFTGLSEKMSPKENFDFLNSYMRRVGPHIREHGGIIDKYIGDAIMALFPGAVNEPIRAAITIQQTVRNYNVYRIARDYQPIKIGIGLHTGTLMLGIVGEHERLEGTVISDTVNIAARLEGLTKIYGASIIVSGPALFTLNDPTEFTYRFLGVVQVKGKEEPISLYEILDEDETTLRELKIQTMQEFEKGIDAFLHEEFQLATELMTKVLEVNPEDLAAQLYRERGERYVNFGTTPGWKGAEVMQEK